MRIVRTIALVMLAALLAAACGSRLDPQVRKQAAAAALNAGGGAGGATTGGTGAVGTGGTTTGGAVPGAGTTTGGAGTTTGGAGTTGGSGGAQAATTGGVHNGGAGSGCAGGATDTGMTANTIAVGNVSSTSGPVAGLFQGALQGTQAFAAYVNSQGGVCGHTLQVRFADDSTNCQDNQNSTEELATKVFAFVGSFSLQDGCGAKYFAAHTNVPDIHVALQPEAETPPNHFDIETGQLGYATGPFEYFAKKYPDKVQAVGMLYANVGGAVPKQHAFENAARHSGWKIVYDRGTDATETDWTGDFVTMCQRDHIKIFFTGAENGPYAAKMVNDERQAGCPSDLVNIIPIAYDQSFLSTIGNQSAAEGMVGWNEYSLFFNSDEADKIPELKLFQSWFQRTYPGQAMTLYALFAWASGRLFQAAMEKAGSKVDRQSLMAALRTFKDFTAGGIVAPMTPSAKSGGVKCYVLWQFHAGKFSRLDDPPSGYRCDGQFLPVNG